MERTVLEERDALSMERLASITKEHTAQEPFGDYFRKTASFVIKMDEVYRKIKDGKTESYMLEQWQAFNIRSYTFLSVASTVPFASTISPRLYGITLLE